MDRNSLAGHRFSHSHQWSYGDTLKQWRDSQTEYMFSPSHQWCCSNTGEQLTSWMHIQPVSDTDLLKHQRTTHKLPVDTCSAVLSVVLIFSITTRESLQAVYACSAILVTRPHLPQCWRVTHKLCTCSVTLVNGSIKWLTRWTHVQPFLWMISELLKYWRATYTLVPYSAVLAVAQNCLSDSHTRSKFSHSHQWLISSNTAEHLTIWLSPFSSILICLNTRGNSQAICELAILIDVLICTNTVTHSLNACSAIYISGSYLLKH
jgi:hypothetical protein